MEPLAALKGAALGLLRAQHAERAAQVLEAAELLIAGTPERWQMGDRMVHAHDIVLVVDPEAFVEVRREPELHAELRQALAWAMQSDQTELKELSLCVRLPSVERPWREVYRTAPVVTAARPPEPDAVLAAAAALLDAAGACDEAELLSRCTLELGEIPAGPPRVLLRCVLRLPPAELVSLQRSRDRQAVIERALTDAVAGPLTSVGEVRFGAAVP